MKRVKFEYGQGFMEAELPDSAEIFIPGETVPDPPYLKGSLSESRNPDIIIFSHFC